MFDGRNRDAADIPEGRRFSRKLVRSLACVLLSSVKSTVFKFSGPMPPDVVQPLNHQST